MRKVRPFGACRERVTLFNFCAFDGTRRVNMDVVDRLSWEREEGQVLPYAHSTGRKALCQDKYNCPQIASGWNRRTEQVGYAVALGKTVACQRQPTKRGRPPAPHS